MSGVAGAGAPPLRAVSLDAMGTLLRLDDPVGRLGAALREAGAEVDAATAGAALRVEVAAYRAGHLGGGDRAGLEALRDHCAAVLHDALGPPAAALPRAAVRAALLRALRFVPLPGAVDALRALRGRGLRLVACSNWDVSLHDALATTGLAGLLDGAVSSAEVGLDKPDPAPLRAALALVGAAPAEAVHVGDDPHADLGAAAAAGVRAVLVGRDDGLEDVAGARSRSGPGVPGGSSAAVAGAPADGVADAGSARAGADPWAGGAVPRLAGVGALPALLAGR